MPLKRVEQERETIDLISYYVIQETRVRIPALPIFHTHPVGKSALYSVNFFDQTRSYALNQSAQT